MLAATGDLRKPGMFGVLWLDGPRALMIRITPLEYPEIL